MFRQLHIKFFFFVIVVLIIGLGLYMRWLGFLSAGVDEFISRDFGRALHLIDGDYIPLAGPDLSNGGRLPGPFLYFLLAFPLLFSRSYEAIFAFNLMLNLSSILILFFLLNKHFNKFFAVLSVTLVSISSLHIRSIIDPLNPAFINIFRVTNLTSFYNTWFCIF